MLLLMLLPTYVKLPIVILEFYTETCNVTAVSRSNVQLVEGGGEKNRVFWKRGTFFVQTSTRNKINKIANRQIISTSAAEITC